MAKRKAVDEATLDYSKRRAFWKKEMRAKGHRPMLESGALDVFASAGGSHNGPKCKTCGWECCWHCTPASEIPSCITESSK